MEINQANEKGPESEFRKPFSSCGNKRIAFPGFTVKNLWRRFGGQVSFA